MRISENDLTDARQSWGDGLIKISQIFESSGIDDAKSFASSLTDNLYGFDLGPILFKPTLSGGPKTFRQDKEGTLSYFVGQNPKYPKDTGFGLKYWRDVRFDTSSTFIEDTVAMWMGWVSFEDKDGKVTKVDKSWGYKKDSKGNLKIILHHSSLPYQD